MASKIKYLFCINTGRSGSHYLSSIFDHVANAISEHEMKPIGHSEVMRQFLKGNPEPMRELSEERLKLIQEKCTNGEVFIETSHIFIKGYGWFFADNIPQEEIGVIILNRDKEKVVSSLERIGCKPLEHRGQNWIMTPAMKSPIIAAPKLTFLSAQMSFSVLSALSNFTKKTLSLFEKINLPLFKYPYFFEKYNRQCLAWYYDETFAQAQKFKDHFPNIHFYHAQINDLNNIDELQKLLDFFQLELTNDLKSIIGKPTNLKNKTS